MKCVTSQSLMLCFALSLGSAIDIVAAPARSSGASKTPEIIARVHSTGFPRSGGDADGRVFREIWTLPATVQLRTEALDKTAAALAGQFEPKAKSDRAACARLIRPLLNDFGTAELLLEVVEHPQDLLEWTLALRLEEARSQLWQANWSQLLAGWTPRLALKTGGVSLLATNSWVVLHWISGAADTPKLPPNAILSNIQQGQRPLAAGQEHWVKVEADLARWNNRARAAGEQFPRVALTMSGRRDYLRTEARLTFRQPMVSRVERWDIPRDTIRDPLISFTALQGVASWLKKQPLFQELGLENAPNQLFLWGLSQTIFQIQAAFPVSDSASAFDRLANKWAPDMNRRLAEHAVGELRRLPDRAELVWRGLPVIVPYVRPIREEGKSYLHAGIFPVDPPTNPPPAQLFQELTSKTNLVYYDWEITQARLTQLRPLAQLASVFLTLSPMSTNSTPSRWLDVIEPRLGNTVTEVSMVSPAEFNLVRTSHLGLNGLELLTMANWLDGTNFPKLNVDVRFRPVAKSGKLSESR